MTFLPTKSRVRRAALAVPLLCALFAGAAAAQAKHPVIIIPGLSGSELRNPKTKERIWFNPFRPRTGRIGLTLDADPTRMHDDLVATDAIRAVKVGLIPFDIYGGFIKALIARGGYHEEKWDAPSAKGGEAAVYVFAYDWRLDNVTNARLLIHKIDELRKKLGKPDLKFDIAAHSMGGIVARYAAMYGDAELPAEGQKPQATWAGARYFDNVVLIGTPNEGAMLALSTFVEGFSYKGMHFNLPLVQDTSKYMVFSIPAAYQLLPAPGAMHIYDDHLQPLNIDLYDPHTWSRYGWDVTQDVDFVDHYSAAERRVASTYLGNALSRARRLHEALAAANGEEKGVRFFTIGCDCRKETLDGVVLYRDSSGAWKTLFTPAGFTREDGTRVSEADVKKVVNSPGDGIVAFHSVNASMQSSSANVASILGAAPAENICEDHNTQATNSKIQDYVIKLLTGIVPPPKQQLAGAKP
ncbi:MAG: lipase family alpha/beta hydrolase [Pyrinomonadaceae bacterium]